DIDNRSFMMQYGVHTEQNIDCLVFIERIGTEGAQYLADLLRDNKTYTKVSLLDSQIEDLRALYMAAALTHNTTLVTLDHTNNQIQR
ncbi:unnamed protein product, partial [Rotaria socialis]